MVKICPVCQKRLADKTAMKQHLAQVHPSWGQPRPAPANGARPRAKPARSRAPQPTINSRVVSGIDVVGMSEFKAPGSTGQVLADIQLTPIAFADTRLQQEAQLWARWRPRALKLEVVSSAGTFVTGSYVAGWTGDYTIKLPKGPDAVRIVTTMGQSKQAHISQTLALPITSESSQRWYLTTGEPSDRDHGQLFVVLSAPVSNLTGSLVLSLRLHWTVEFSSPTMPKHTSSEYRIYADPGYVPYFTDSVSDWANGTRLTLKHSEGGSVVPFVGIEDEVVYQCDAYLNYYEKKADKSGNELKSLRLFGVKIKDYYVPGMALFKTAEKAAEYIKNGAVEAAIKFEAAGPWKTGNPGWAVYTGPGEGLQLHAASTVSREISIGPGDRYPSQPEVRELSERLDRLTALVEGLLSTAPSRRSSFSALGEPPGNCDAPATRQQ